MRKRLSFVGSRAGSHPTFGASPASDERHMPFAGEIVERRRFGGQAALQEFNERGRLARRPGGALSDLKRAPAALQ
jgi:hypothetical protein